MCILDMLFQTSNACIPEKNIAQCSKIRKSAISKVQKKTFLPFQKWQKNNYCTGKKFKTTKNGILELLSGCKN